MAKGPSQATMDETAEQHLAYLMRLAPGEVIRPSTDQYYDRYCKNQQATEIKDPLLNMIKGIVETRKSGGELALDFTSLSLRIKEQENAITTKAAEFGAIGMAFQFLALNADRQAAQNSETLRQFIITMQAMTGTAIGAIEKSNNITASKETFELAKSTMEMQRAEIERLNIKTVELEAEMRALREARLEHHMDELNHMTERHNLSQQMEDLERKMARTEEEIRDQLKKEGGADEADKEKFFLLRDSFIGDMDKLTENALKLGDRAEGLGKLWGMIKGMTVNKKEEKKEEKPAQSGVPGDAKTAA